MAGAWSKALPCGCIYGFDGQGGYATPCVKGCKKFRVARARAKIIGWESLA